ncbi:SPOR domain-containing protein [Longibacter salinarum]|uniref:SPOR domain-containing protein n=1 Tax=Longibacter salinarum TaxID=1850348 RepID=UPI0015CF0A10|nr:SPOR domain-containing protein [Longibacter salinarum]
MSDSEEESGGDVTEAEPPRRTYHVQVRTVEEKTAADRTVSDVVAWFEALPDADRPDPLSGVGNVPVDVRWKAPFYRVRIGPFSSRDAATAVLDALKSDFPDAFIAREAVGSRY